MTRRKRHGCRPNRTPAAGRRDRRQSIGPPQPFPSPRRARQAKPGASPVCGLPLVQPPRRFLPPRRAWDTDETADASPSGSGRGPAFRAEAAEARGESRRVFRARRDWRRAGSPRGAEAEAKASGSIHLAESCRRYPPSRQASFAKQNGYSGVPEKARSELLPAPQRRTTGLSTIAQPEYPG